MWAIVELMGHRQRAGLVSDSTLGGTTMLRIEHPTVAIDDEPLCEYYSAHAIYAIRPCSREVAIGASQWWTPPAAPGTPALAAPLDELVDDQDDEPWEDD